MGKQPEARLSRRIINSWRKRGAWAYKVHGSEMQPAGIPDISGVYDTFSVWCETKMPGNKPSAIQVHRINQIRKAGGLVVIAYNQHDAEEMLDHLDSGEHDEDCRCTYTEEIS